MTTPSVRAASFDELTARQLHDILRLRSDVFIVEQDCAYPDVDGRDLEPATVHLWIEDDGGQPLSYLRILRDPDDTQRFGRVVTATAARGRGLSAVLIRAAMERTDGPVLIHAQAHLRDWYARFGFEVCGEGFLEDGIPHLPMLLDR